MRFNLYTLGKGFIFQKTQLHIDLQFILNSKEITDHRQRDILLYKSGSNFNAVNIDPFKANNYERSVDERAYGTI
jgi:hypothetical protein